MEIEFAEDLNTVSIAFFVAKRPHQRLAIDYFRFRIGDHDFSGHPQELPNNQGLWVGLGDFEDGTTFDLEWRFWTGMDVPIEDDAVLGHFPDGRLTKATRFERLRLEPGSEYGGTVSITVRRP